MESNPTPPPTIRPRWQILLAGTVVGDIAIALQYAFWIFASKKLYFPGTVGIFAWPSLFLVPALGGLIASYIWRPLKPSIGSTFLNSLWMTLLALFVATVAFREGVICLLIVSPLFYVAVLAGALFGRILFRSDPTRLQVSLLPLLALVALAEPLVRSDQEAAVTDELLIHAPPAKVWPQVKAFPPIQSAPRFWLFRLGLPYPLATTSAGDFLNADRQCIFSQDAVFKERVVDLVPQERLAFDIVESPQDPELIGHLTPHRGEFVLRDNADGTTTLVGSTWYTLHIRPLWYFDLWTHHIFRAVHLRVMEDIRRRAEASP
jgi:hypothetical protein